MSVNQPTAYIAGPMRGYPEWNFPAFHAAEEALRAVGYLTINPARRDEEHGLDASGITAEQTEGDVEFDLNEALAWDLDQIAKVADLVVVLPGWEESKGAAAEVATAHALRKPVKTLAEATLEGWMVEDRVRVTRKPFFMLDGVPRWQSGPDALGVGYEGVIELVDERVFGGVWAGSVVIDGWATAIACLERVEPEPAVAPINPNTLDQPMAEWERELLDPFGDEGEEEVPQGLIDLVSRVRADEEVRVTSETGGQKGRKGVELSTIDPLALIELGKVSSFGAQKYESFNYVRGYDWTLSADAAFRHLLAFLAGEDLDPESGLPHTAHFAWHGLALTTFLLRGVGTDTRVETVLEGYRAKHAAEVAA